MGNNKRLRAEKTACQRVGETSRDTAVQYKAVTLGYLRCHEEWQRQPIMILMHPFIRFFQLLGDRTRAAALILDIPIHTAPICALYYGHSKPNVTLVCFEGPQGPLSSTHCCCFPRGGTLGARTQVMPRTKVCGTCSASATEAFSPTFHAGIRTVY